MLRAYAYQCAMCGFGGALGRNPVGIEAAHVRWHSQDGPDVVANGLALCALHHALFDLGVLGLTAELRIRVSNLCVARSDAGRLGSGRPLRPAAARTRPGQPVVELVHVDRHHRQVFKRAGVEFDAVSHVAQAGLARGAYAAEVTLAAACRTQSREASPLREAWADFMSAAGLVRRLG